MTSHASAWSAPAASCSWSVELPTEALSSSGVPSATLRPWSMTAMRSASWSASSRYCVVSRTVQPSATRLRIVSHIWPRVRGSRPVVGSSRKISGGRVIRLAARSRRRRMPPENCESGRAAASSSPNCTSSRSAVARASDERRPWRRPKSHRFSVAVRFSSTDAYWPVTPINWRTRWGSRATSTPKIWASPASIGSSVASIRSIVVLPAPFGPRTPRISPWLTSRSMPSTARRAPKVFTRPRAWTAVVVISVMAAKLGGRGFTTPTSRFHDVARGPWTRASLSGAPPREGDQRRQNEALEATTEDRGVRLGVVGPREQSEVEQVARHAAPAHASGLGHLDDLGEHLLHVERRGAGDAHPDLVVAGVREAVDDAGRDLDDVAGGGSDVAQSHAEAHRAAEHLEALGLDRVHVRDRDRAAGGEGQVEAEPRTVGGRGGLDEAEALAGDGVLECGAWSDHELQCSAAPSGRL